MLLPPLVVAVGNAAVGCVAGVDVGDGVDGDDFVHGAGIGDGGNGVDNIGSGVGRVHGSVVGVAGNDGFSA
jgi:hypothetical protein